nr:hypothetical protein [Tanacetum cinerariifolium]
MHNNIMAAGLRDRPPMLATGRYAQWQSCFIRYVDTKPSGDALRKCILQGPYTLSTVRILDERLLLPPKQTPPKTDKTLCTRLLLDLLLIKDIQFERDDIFNIISHRKHSRLDTLYSF